MNNRKYLIGLVLGTFIIIVIYNFFVIQYFQHTPMAKMEMNGYGWTSTLFLMDVHCLLIVGVLLMALLFFKMIHSRNNRGGCTQCGKTIENNRWKICPVCGTIIKSEQVIK